MPRVMQSMAPRFVPKQDQLLPRPGPAGEGWEEGEDVELSSDAKHKLHPMEKREIRGFAALSSVGLKFLGVCLSVLALSLVDGARAAELVHASSARYSVSHRILDLGGGRTRSPTLDFETSLGGFGGMGQSADGRITLALGRAGFLDADYPLNLPPTISAIANQNGDGGATPLAPFTIGDSATAAADLQVTGASSNPALVPSGSIRLAGSGANRTVQVLSAPGKTGSSMITVTVTDAEGGQSTARFSVTVNVPAPKSTPEINWPAPASIVFGTSLTSLQLNASAQVPGTFVYTPAAGTKLNAGTADLSVTFTPDDSETYQTSSKTVTLTVAKAPLTIRAENKFKREGDPLPNLTAIFSGLVSPDTPASLDNPVTLSTTANASSPIGNYPITASGASDANYTITLLNGTLTVTTRLLPTVTWANPAAITYGTALGGTQLNATADVSGTFAYSPSAGAVLRAGQGRPLTVTFTPNDTINFEPVTVVVAMDVLKAPLTIRAENQSKVYGAALPAFTASYSGFVTQDTAANLDSAVTFTTAATASSNAGNYSISAGGASDADYAITFEPGTLTVTKAPLTIRAENKSKVYGEALPELTASYTGLVNQDTPASLDTPVSLTTTATAVSGVGSYAITASAATDANYTITFAPGTLSVAKAALAIRAEDKSKVYGAALPSLTASYSGFVAGDTAANLSTPVTLSTTATSSSNAGIYSISAAGAASTNYSITFEAGTLTVTKAPLTIRAEDKSKMYGAALPPLTASYGGFVNEDSAASLDNPATLSTAATASSNAGTYSITVAGAADANYAITFESGTLTVTKATLTVRAENKAKMYGEALPALTATYSGFILQDTAASLDMPVTLTTTATASSNVGNYTITASGAADVNYAISFETGTLVVNKAPLTIRAEDKFKTVGDALPALTAAYTGFVNQDDPDNLDSPVALSTTANASSAAGSYPITADGAADLNYQITHISGTMTVTTKRLPVISWPAPSPIVYGTALSAAQLNATADVAGTFSYNPPSGTVLSAGQGALLAATFTPNDSSEYESLTVVAGINVLRAPLTIRSQDKSKVYGETLPALSAIYSGFVNSDTAASLDIPPSLNTTATASSAPGTFPITAVGASDPNYSISYEPGTFTITKAPLTIRAEDKSKRYGAELPELTARYIGLVNDDTAESLDTAAALTTTASASSHVGVFPITVSGASDANYTITFESGTLTVAKAPLTIRADNKSKVYGAALPALTASYSGFANQENASDLETPATLSTTATASSNAGTFPIAVSGAADANYDITFEPGILTVAPALLTIRAENKTKVYGATIPALTIAYTGFVNQDTAANLDTPPSLSTSGSTLSGVGTYPINVNGANDANYSITFTPGTLTITPALLTVRADDKSKVYGAPLPALTAAYSGFVSQDTAASLDSPVSLSTSATASSGVGTYPILATGARDANYTISLESGTLTVTRAPLTIRADDKFVRQGQTIPFLTATYTGFVNHDNADSLDAPAAFNTTATASSSAGRYPITASGASDANYTITHVDGTLTVTTRIVPRVTWASPAPIRYGTALGAAQLNATADVPGSFSYQPPLGTVLTTAHGAVLAATFTPSDSTTYETVVLTTNLEIQKTPLTIRADNKSKAYGAALPALTASYSGFVNGDTAASLSSPVILSTSASVLSGVSNYPILAGGAAHPYYAITFEPGTLTVTPAALTVTPKRISRRVGTPNPPLTGIIRGLKNGDPISASYSTTATAESPLGEYPITATLIDSSSKLPNYNATLEEAILTVQLETTFTGVAQDGYVANAVVFFDANKDGSMNASEPFTHSDSRGVFDLVVRAELFDSNGNGVLDPAEGTIVLSGGVDISTGLPLQTPLSAPPGSTVINPLTTLLTATIASNPTLTIEESKAKLNQALGIPPSVELTSYDPIAAASDNDGRAKEVLAAGAKVQDTLVQISSLVGASGSDSKAQAASAVIQALATSVSTGASINLDQPAVVKSLIEQSATTLGKSVSSEIKDGAARIIAEANQVKTEIVASIGNALDAAQEISRTQVTGQGLVADVLEQVGSGAVTVTQAATQAGKDAVMQSVQTAPVGDILGTDERPGRFFFGQSAFQPAVGATTAPVILNRTDGNFGSVTLRIVLKTTAGAVVATVPVTFDSRELTKTIDLLPQISGSAQLARQTSVPLALELAAGAPEQSELGNPASSAMTVRTPPRILQQPANQSIPRNGSFTLSVSASGIPSPTFQWRKNGNNLSGQTGASLTVAGASEADAGQYEVVVANNSGTVLSQAAQVAVVSPPVITSSPVSQQMKAGATLNLEVRASGLGLSFEWRKDGAILSNASQSTFTRQSAQESDSGEYQVIVRNLAGAAVSSGALVRVYRPIVFETQPQGQTIPAGSPVTLSARADGTGPLTYQWFKDGLLVPGATRSDLPFSPANSSDSGTYYVEVVGPFGALSSAGARLEVFAPPRITGHPVNRTVLTGEDVRFVVEATGSAPLTFQWFKDNAPLAGALGPELLLKKVQSSDAGAYAVHVSNRYGNASSLQAELIVTVLNPPNIVLQPQSQSALKGSNVLFQVVAGGTPPLKHQWFKDGVPIAGATADRLALTAVQSSDAGNYTVTVSNDVGGVLSVVATLSVQEKKAVRGDLDGNGSPDIVLQDRSGFLGVWSMAGARLLLARYLEPRFTGDAAWQVAASGDWNADGNEDLLFQHSDGTLAVWLMNQISLQTSTLLMPGTSGDPRWRVIGSGDLNSDGHPDILFEHQDGTLAAWLMKGINLQEAKFLEPALPGDDQWKAVGLSDLNSDSKPDLLFQHRDGTVGVWLLEETKLTRSSLLDPAAPSPSSWRVVGAADWNEDGHNDLLFQNAADGSLALWFMEGLRLKEGQFTNPSTPGGTWKPVAPK